MRIHKFLESKIVQKYNVGKTHQTIKGALPSAFYYTIIHIFQGVGYALMTPSRYSTRLTSHSCIASTSVLCDFP